MENKKKYTIIIAIILIYLVIVFVALYFYNKKNGKNYMVLSATDAFEYRENGVEKISILKLKDTKQLQLFSEGTKKGTYKTKVSNAIELIGHKEEWTDHLNLGIPKNSTIKPISFIRKELSETDIEELHQVLNQEGIQNYEDLSISEKIKYDLNQDGIHETIYIVSNIFIEETYDKIFSFIYLKTNSEIQFLMKKIDNTSNTYNMCQPFLHHILDFNKDKTFEMIIGCSYFDQLGVQYDFIRNENSKYISIMK